jgi:transketolase
MTAPAAATLAAADTPALDEADRARLAGIARDIRRDVIRAIHAVQTGHAGTSLSMIEILTMLYFRHARVDPARPSWPDRDYVILSKGHGAPGYYGALAHAGFLDREELLTLRQHGSRLQGHPSAKHLPGVDASTGSLGQGLSIGVGLALGSRLAGRPNRVFCILGDGELQEGQSWEAVMAGAALRLDNLVAIVDRNGLQNDGDTERVMPLGDVEAKWRAFGWRVWSVDGHDLSALDGAFRGALRRGERPAAIIANTVKGKGVSYMENVVKWHHHPINEAEYRQAVLDLEGTAP